MLTIDISANFGVTISSTVLDGVLPTRFTASQWNIPKFCSFVIERRTKYEMLRVPFWIRVEFRSELFLSHIISGRGEPVAPHSKSASLPSSTTTSWGWIENTGFQITVVKNDHRSNYHIFLYDGDRKLALNFCPLQALWPHGFCARFRIDRSRLEPWQGTLCCVFGQDTQLSQCLSPPRSINGHRRIAGETWQIAWQWPAMD